MSKRSSWAIPIANEMGYFPTFKQGKEIEARACHLYAEHFAPNPPPRGGCDEGVFQSTARKAIDEMMGGERPPSPLMKAVGDELSVRVIAAAHEAGVTPDAFIISAIERKISERGAE